MPLPVSGYLGAYQPRDDETGNFSVSSGLTSFNNSEGLNEFQVSENATTPVQIGQFYESMPVDDFNCIAEDTGADHFNTSNPSTLATNSSWHANNDLSAGFTDANDFLASSMVESSEPESFGGMGNCSLYESSGNPFL